MVTIVKHGKPPWEREYRLTCYNCETVFDCKKNEFANDRDPREPVWSIDCPVCQQTLYFNNLDRYIKTPARNEDHTSR